MNAQNVPMMGTTVCEYCTIIAKITLSTTERFKYYLSNKLIKY